MLLALMLAISGQLPWDVSFENLAQAKLNQDYCSANFGTGSIAVAYAFNVKGDTASPVAIVKGRTKAKLRSGQRMYARFYGGTYRNAYVAKASEGRATVVISKHAVGNILNTGDGHLMLRSDEKAKGFDYDMLIFSDNQLDREKLVKALDCLDEQI